MPAKSPPQMRCIFSQVRAVHADQQVVLVVVLIGELPRRVAVAGYPMLCQLAPRRGIDRVADFLPAGGRRFDMKLWRQPSPFHQVLHHKLGHRAAADVPMADKQDILHTDSSPKTHLFLQYSRYPRFRQEHFPNVRLSQSSAAALFWISRFRRPSECTSTSRPWSIRASMMTTFCVQFRRIASASNSGVSPYIR